MVPRLHVDARVVPVVSQAGEIDVPADVDHLGWWIGGAAPGAAVGSTVVVGHVDSAAAGAGALFHLDQIHRNDRIDVTVTGGNRIAYQVDSLLDVKKTAGLRASLFRSTGSPQLVLITCGGPFDERTKSYADNIVVTAQPH